MYFCVCVLHLACSSCAAEAASQQRLQFCHSAAEHYDCTQNSRQNHVRMGTSIKKILSKTSLWAAVTQDQVKHAGIDCRAAVVKNESVPLNGCQKEDLAEMCLYS